jgi:PAS domain S-box-containing protein
MPTDAIATRTTLDPTQFCRATEHSPIGTAIVGLDGRWLNVNAALRRFLGYSADELNALTFQDLTDADDLDADLAQLEALLAGDIASYQMEKRYIRKDGGRVWAELTVSLVRDNDGAPLYFISHVQDIEARKVDETERLRLQDRATLATQAARIGIFEWELGSSALSWSPEMFDLFQVEDPGHPLDFAFFARCVHEDDRAPLEQGIAQALQEGRLDTEFRIRAGDDIRIIKVLAKIHRAGDGAPHRMIGANWDVTEVRMLARKAEDANQAKSRFLAVMSHEIRTPMNGILGMAQAMRGDDLPTIQRERLDVIAECGESLLTILNDILDLSKVEAGKLELEATPFDLRRLLNGMVATYAPTAQDRGLDLNLDLGDAEGVYRGDPTRVRQILANLVSNALKFTAEGSVSVAVRRTDAGLAIAVTDTGLGMDAEVLGRIFSPFAQEDTSTTRRFGGTGLGLSIVRELAVLMQGDVTVASAPGAGSRFTLTVPLDYLGAALDADQDAAVAAPTASTPLRILAAEDNATNQLVLKTLLLQMGIEVTVVSDGLQAFDAWRGAEWDVVLMDVQMPVMDGFAATRLIRDAEIASGRAPTPIVALTANAMPHHERECLDAGMNALVAKPIDVRVLVSTIEAAARGAYADPDAPPMLLAS